MPASAGPSSGNSTSSPSQTPSPSILDVLSKYKYNKRTGNEERLKLVENGGTPAAQVSGSPLDRRDGDTCVPETPESDIPSPGSPVIAPTYQKRQGRALSTDSDDCHVPTTGKDKTSLHSRLGDNCHDVLNHDKASVTKRTSDKHKKAVYNNSDDSEESPLPPSFLSNDCKKGSLPARSSPQQNRTRRLVSSSDSDEVTTQDEVSAVISARSCHTLSPSESETEEDTSKTTSNDKVKLSSTSNKRGIIFISEDEDSDSQLAANNCDSRSQNASSSRSQPPKPKKGRFVVDSDDDDDESSAQSTKHGDYGKKLTSNKSKHGVTYISEDDEDDEAIEVHVISSPSGSEKENSPSNSDAESMEDSNNRRSPTVPIRKKKIFDVNKFKSAIAKGLTESRNNRQADRMQRKKQADLLFGADENRVRELPVYDSDDDNATNRRENPTRIAVTSFFNAAPVEELMCIPGCKQAKLDVLLSLRPYRNWADLLRKMTNDRNLSTDMLNGAQEVMTVRSVVMGLMKRCEKISSEIEQLVNGLMDGSQAGHIAEQPRVLNPNVHLASYQLLGLNWLALMHRQNLNGILADEMGLGKTVQAIAFLSHLLEEGDHGPHLIVVPSSTLENWVRELHTWCNKLNVVVYYGSQEDRRLIRHDILKRGNLDFHVLVTTYNIVSSTADDKKLIKRIGFHYVIFDEAHMLKNMVSLRFKNLMKIMAKRRLLLTGTPLQNNLIELMSLLIFVMPDIFYGKTEEIKQLFARKTIGSNDDTNYFVRERIEHAKRIMRPFVLRRLKKDVLRDLPKKHEAIENCALSDLQRKLYDDLILSLSKQVQENKGNQISNSGAGMMMQLRKLANHPLLLRYKYTDDTLRKIAKLMLKEPTHREADPDLIYEDLEIMSDFELHGLCCRYKSVEKYKLDAADILDSGKFQYLDGILPAMKERGNRVLLFSQFTMVLDIIEWYMKHRKYDYLRLDGQTKVDTRQELIDKYTNDGTIFVFLLSTRAGGLGINLTAADNVIIHDIDFNPYNDKQAEDRCHRVGQTKEVSVIRLISSKTIEEGILQCGQEKLKLEQDVTGAQADSENELKKDVATLLQTALGL